MQPEQDLPGVVVTGVSNKITIAIAKLTPKSMLMSAVSGLQEKP